MNSDFANPYAPPKSIAAQEEVQPGELKSVSNFSSIPFAGRINRRELDEYFRADGHVGCVRLTTIAIGFGGIFLVLPILWLPFLAISAGALGILSIVLIVSTMPYRRLTYKNVNPDWEATIRGSLQPEGIRLIREQTSTFYRWNWYGAAVTSKNVVALLPATQTGVPLLISREMIAKAEDWELLQHITEEIGKVTHQRETEDFHRDQNLRILKDQRRGWIFTPPQDAIAFEGIVWSDDYRLLPRRNRSHARPLRTYFVIYGLVAFAGLILAGCSALLFEQIAILPVIVALYVLAAMAMGRRRRRKRGNAVIYYLRGYALAGSIVTDFGLAVSETAWPGLVMVANTDQNIVLRRCGINNYVVIRKDMFAAEESWLQFRNLVSEKLAVR